MNKHSIRFPDLSERVDMPELMDDTSSDQQLLVNTLRQFRLINRFLTPVRRLLKNQVLKQMMKEPNREYHLVDLGAGGCETAVWLLRQAQRNGLHLRITACDHDPRVVQYARDTFGKTPRLTIQQRSVLDIDAFRPVDFVFANHLLHHLKDADIYTLLDSLSRLDKKTVMISDIHRSRTVYTSFYLVSAMLFRNSFARDDGLLSIRKGFTPREFRTFSAAAASQETSCEIKTMPPGHIVLLMRNRASNSEM